MTRTQPHCDGDVIRANEWVWAALRPGLAVLGAAVIAASACRDGARPTQTVAMADTADQVLFGMSYYVTVEGVRRARVEADTAYFYTPTQSAELRVVTVTFFDTQGAQTSTLTCHEGTYHWRTGDMEGRGDVKVVTTDGKRLSTPRLRYYQNRDEVESDTSFTYFKPPSETVVGESFVSDPSFRSMRVKQPRGTGGGFALPNQ